MGALDLTVQVMNISPKATVRDLHIFFSYCGTIDEIRMQRRADESQVAYVTFKQPYAFQTALLLDDAVLAGNRVHIVPLQESIVTIPIKTCILDDKRNSEARKEGGGILLAPQVLVQARALKLKGHEVASKAKERVSDTGWTPTQQANLAISTAQKTVSNIPNITLTLTLTGSTIMSSDCFSKGLLWLSNVLNKASKRVAEFGEPKQEIATPGSRNKSLLTTSEICTCL